jgi:hypothetical protein
VDGEWGPELVASVPSPTGPTQMRFVGIDGPRWFLRAVIQGRGAADPEGDPALGDMLRGCVVVRGKEAMPIRDPLPLRMPRPDEHPGGPDDAGRPLPGLPERGPEITETR